MFALAVAALSLSCSAPMEVDDPIARVDAFLRGETRLEDLEVFALARDRSPESQEAWARLQTGLAFLTMQAGPDAGPGCKWSRAQAQMVLARAVDGNCEISVDPRAMVTFEEIALSIRAAQNNVYGGFDGINLDEHRVYTRGLERLSEPGADGMTRAWYVNEVGFRWCSSRAVVMDAASYALDNERAPSMLSVELIREARAFDEAPAALRIRARAWLDEHETQ